MCKYTKRCTVRHVVGEIATLRDVLYQPPYFQEHIRNYQLYWNLNRAKYVEANYNHNITYIVPAEVDSDTLTDDISSRQQ